MNDVIGYAASLFVVVSLLMSDITRLRYINLIGCLLFVIYGLLLHAYPVALMNTAAMLINIYYLLKTRKENTN